jgi:hypothetical protein
VTAERVVPTTIRVHQRGSDLGVLQLPRPLRRVLAGEREPEQEEAVRTDHDADEILRRGCPGHLDIRRSQSQRKTEGVERRIRYKPS